MQIFNQLPDKAAKRMGVGLFVVSCVLFVAAVSLPFVTLPVSGAAKAGLITVVAVAGELAFAASVALLGKAYLAKLTAFVSVPDKPFGRFFLLAGFGVWAVATVLLRLVGQYILIPGNTPLTVAAFAGLTIGMLLLMTVLYGQQRVRGSERLLAATLFMAPGMILDGGVVLFFTNVLPNMPPEASSLFAAWLFWGYSVVLLTGLLTPRKTDE